MTYITDDQSYDPKPKIQHQSQYIITLFSYQVHAKKDEVGHPTLGVSFGSCVPPALHQKNLPLEISRAKNNNPISEYFTNLTY